MAESALLFELPNSAQQLRDPSFGKNKIVPLHRWVPWVAGFSADFVDDSLSKYLPPKIREPWVLDPFAGVGTTLVQGYLRGCNVLGFEINPYAALATEVKLDSALIPVPKLEGTIARFEKHFAKYSTSKRYRPRHQPPEGFQGKTKLFSERVQRKVLVVLDFVNAIPEKPIRDLFRLALGSVMISFSNYSYEPSLTRRIAVGKAEIGDADVAGAVTGKLRTMLGDIREFQAEMHSSTFRPKNIVICDSFLDAPQRLAAQGFKKISSFVDLIITSPPYLNNYHYPRNTRPQLHWLGLANGRGYGAANEQKSFGKFWQTVRELPPVRLNFEMPELNEVISTIAFRNPEKAGYGGAGWANYVATYFNDTHQFCRVAHSLLKRDARAVVVLGNSVIQGVEVKTDRYFGQIAELAGLKFEETVLLRKKRTGSSIIQSSVRVDKAPEKAVLYESAIVLRKA